MTNFILKVQFSWENSELVIWVKERTVSWVNTITFLDTLGHMSQSL